jgi:peroxiredoxin
MGIVDLDLDGRSSFLILLLIFLFLGNSCAKVEDAAISYAPKEPRPGDNLMIRYDPEGTDLSKAPELELIAYLFSNELPEAKSLPLKKSGREWITTVPTEKSTLLVAIKVLAGQAVDSNKGKGYFIRLYDQEGNVLPGSRASLADAISYWNGILGIDADFERALALFEEDFKSHPEIKKDYLVSYFNLIYTRTEDSKKLRLYKELEELEAKPDLTLKELDALHFWYTFFHKTDAAERIGRILIKRDPKGRAVRYERFLQLDSIKDLDGKFRFVAEIKKEFPNSPGMSALHGYILDLCLKHKEYAKAKEYLDDNADTVNGRDYVNLASNMLKMNADLALAEEIIAKGVDLARHESSDRRTSKPSYLTEKEWRGRQGEDLGGSLKTYGGILLKRGQEGRALRVLEEASLFIGDGDPEFNEFYAEAMLGSGDMKEALPKIGSLIASGNSTPRMKDLFKTAYIKSTGSEIGLADHLKKLEDASTDRILAEIKGKLRDMAAPEFSLEDLEGQKVSLSRLRGKIVILDFWATWCGPCQESFPGMRLLVERYGDDPDVRFLFIDSWERAQDKKKNASDFIAKNEYPFHVLLDVENKVISAYKVSGVPTKFVIDKNGSIRYISEGYEGNMYKMFDELRSVIESIR